MNRCPGRGPPRSSPGGRSPATSLLTLTGMRGSEYLPAFSSKCISTSRMRCTSIPARQPPAMDPTRRTRAAPILLPPIRNLSIVSAPMPAALHQENPSQPIPVDLLTTSASGLDPEISPAAAEFQIPRIAHERGLSEAAVGQLVQKHTSQRDLGLLGEPRVDVLELNLALDSASTV